MLLMLRLLAITLLLSSVSYANNDYTKIEDFIDSEFSNNKSIVSFDAKVLEKKPLENVKNWYGYIIEVKAVVKATPKNRTVQQRMIWFSDGNVITADLKDLQSGESLKDSVRPKFQAKFYKPEYLIYGNENAKHKVAIFSDPMCPFCREFTPPALEYMKKYPNDFAVYFFHLPLPRIHQASPTLVQAAIAAELKGVKEVVLKLYKVDEKILHETDVNKILQEFNKSVGTHITQADIKSPQVVKIYEQGISTATNLMVRGTPTIYLDGEVDMTKSKYKKVKIK